MTDKPMTSIKKIRAIDLFCGIGGNSWGAREAGVQIVAGFDMWELACDVYKDNFPEARVFPSRLQEVNLGKIKNQLGEIDLILASPECTSHSVARGNKEASCESQNLAYQVLRFAKVFNPRWIVIENVTNMRNWNGYKKFLKELKKIYKVRPLSLLASRFGVAQSRRRLYILCDRIEKPEKVVPVQSEKAQISQYINLNGAYHYNPLITEKRAKATLDRAQRAIDRLGKNEPFLLVYYGTDKAGGWQRLDMPLRTITTVDRFALVKPGENGNGHVMRMLQPAELKLAMGFPERFRLARGTRRNKVHLLGNAVCPPVMQTIIEQFINPLLLSQTDHEDVLSSVVG